MPVVCNLCKGNIMVPAGKRQVPDVDDGLKLCGIRIAPEHISLWPIPGKMTDHLDAPRHLVEGKTCKIRIVGQDQIQVINAVLQKAGPGLIFESLLPVIVAGSKVRFRLGQALIGSLQLHIVLLHGKLTHRLKGRLLIQIAKLVNPDNIKSIAEFEISRVLRMVAVHELVILDLHTGHAAGSDQVIAVLLVRRLIYIGKERIESPRNREEDPVEQTDRALFRKRVLNLLLRDLVCLALPG